MKAFMKRLLSGVLAVSLCVSMATTSFAAEENKTEKGIMASVGDWFSDKGKYIKNVGGNAGKWVGEHTYAAKSVAVYAVDYAGEWFDDRKEDIQNVTADAMATAGDWFGKRAEDICRVKTVIVVWGDERIEEIQIALDDAGECIGTLISSIDPSELADFDYYVNSGEIVLFGDYSEKDPTALSLGLNLAASIANVDIGMDIRDLIYDIQNYGSGEIKKSGIAIDVIALLPLLGLLKPIKYIDSIADGAKMIGDAADTATDIGKNVDRAADMADGIHDMAKTVDTASDLVVVSKDISKVALEDLPDAVQDTFKTYSDVGWDGEKALENLSEGTHAGQVFDNRDDILPIFDKAGNELDYHEFDAFSLGMDPDAPNYRGACRFVRDNLGNVYYTTDHYNTFSMIETIVG